MRSVVQSQFYTQQIADRLTRCRVTVFICNRNTFRIQDLNRQHVCLRTISKLFLQFINVPFQHRDLVIDPSRSSPGISLQARANSSLVPVQTRVVPGLLRFGEFFECISWGSIGCGSFQRSSSNAVCAVRVVTSKTSLLSECSLRID